MNTNIRYHVDKQNVYITYTNISGRIITELMCIALDEDKEICQALILTII